jgi:hypothetical protein
MRAEGGNIDGCQRRRRVTFSAYRRTVNNLSPPFRVPFTCHFSGGGIPPSTQRAQSSSSSPLFRRKFTGRTALPGVFWKNGSLPLFQILPSRGDAVNPRGISRARETLAADFSRAPR